MSQLNAEWHKKNKMPKNPTLDERIAWHVAHARNCSCRPLGGKILEEIKKRGIEIDPKSDAKK
jgi:hypothetical protein